MTAEPDAAVLLRAAAAGRLEYATSFQANEENVRLREMRDALLTEAATLETAARIVEGDYRPLYGLLPTWRWTEQMDRLVLSDRGDTISAADVADLVPAEPGYDRIADAIDTATEAACIDVTVVHDGQPASLYSLARCLDKAGLIDWSALDDDEENDRA